MIMTIKLNRGQMIRKAAMSTNEILAVEAESIDTGEVLFCLFEGEDGFNCAYHAFPLSEWKLTFHGRKWARQTLIQEMILRYVDLEDEAVDAWEKYEENYTSQWYKTLADVAYSHAWHCGERIAELLSRWTGKEKKVCLKEVWDCNVSYADIQE